MLEMIGMVILSSLGVYAAVLMLLVIIALVMGW